jgi:uncharacterized protein (DUF433 family)
MSKTDLPRRIVVEPNVCGGKPVIRATRTLVAIVLDALAEGLTPEQFIEHYPQLTIEDIHAALAFRDNYRRNILAEVSEGGKNRRSGFPARQRRLHLGASHETATSDPVAVGLESSTYDGRRDFPMSASFRRHLPHGHKWEIVSARTSIRSRQTVTIAENRIE